MQLNEVKRIDAQSCERLMYLVARFGITALASFGGQKEILSVLCHPRPDTLFGIPVAGSSVYVVNPIFQKLIQGFVRFRLRHTAQSSSAKDNHGTHMAGAPKGSFLNHDMSPL